MIPLSKLAITGFLHLNTPQIVIQEVADAHNITYTLEDLHWDIEDEAGSMSRIENLLEEIHNVPIPAVPLTQDYSKTHLKLIARFVNDEERWVKSKLLRAFNFCQQYMNQSSTIPNVNFVAGRPTSEFPYNYSASLLYRICICNGIHTTYHMTLDNLATAVRLLAQPTANLQSILTSQLNMLNRQVLINSVINMGYDNLKTFVNNDTNETPTLPPVSYQSLLDTSVNLSRSHLLLQRISPQNASEAVMLAALNYKIDVSSAINPVIVYNNLSTGLNTIKDPAMRRYLDINPYRFNLTHYFNPNFPASLYYNNDLHMLALNEGYTESDLNRSDAYELLQIAYLTQGFHAGKHLSIENADTLFHSETVNELSGNEVLCYGILNESLIAMTYRELHDAFVNSQNFINPLSRSKELFTKREICKLKNLCLMNFSNDNALLQDERKKLYMLITELEVLQDKYGNKIKKFLKLFKVLDKSDKDNVQTCFHLLMDMAMYMRSWNGQGTYPLQITPALPENVVETNVQGAITKFVEACNKLEHIMDSRNVSLKERLLNLPLIYYRNSTFQLSSSQSEGLTIGQRLDIVRQGEQASPTVSCIRLSSNWFVATSYHYLQITGVLPPFHINQLKLLPG